jgi:phosphatidylserine/phosphatidylglycerophosphate/cardiolipin synthase-like enzyme
MGISQRLALLCLILTLASPAQAFDLTLHDTPAAIYFSPRGGATEAIVHRVDQAQRSIFVLAYSFTSRPIAEALAKACLRGVHVEIIVDRTQRRAKGSQAQLLADAGAQVSVDTKHAIAHNKVLIIDGRTLVTGSFNFTAGAEEKNAENLLILDSPELARLYLGEWDRLRGQAVRW